MPLGVVLTLLIALGLGVLLSLGQISLLVYCFELKHCYSRGDGNMSYYFQSILSIPGFWLAGWIAKIIQDSRDQAESRNAEAVSPRPNQGAYRCPNCRRSLAPGLSACPSCGALFGTQGGWVPERTG